MLSGRSVFLMKIMCYNFFMTSRPATRINTKSNDKNVEVAAKHKLEPVQIGAIISCSIIALFFIVAMVSQSAFSPKSKPTLGTDTLVNSSSAEENDIDNEELDEQGGETSQDDSENVKATDANEPSSSSSTVTSDAQPASSASSNVATSSSSSSGSSKNSAPSESKKSSNAGTSSTKSTTASPEAPSSSSAPIESVTTGQKNALLKAQSYLRVSAFSYQGLIEQLKYEGYSDSEAKYGVDNCGANWNEQALKKAKSYLSISAFSRKRLIEQLEYDQFTNAQATYGVNNCGADWNEQAAKKAKSYLSIMAFSRQGLIDQLEFDGFTHDQAVYGVTQNGY